MNSRTSPTSAIGAKSNSLIDLDSAHKGGGNLYPGLPPKRVLGIGGTDIVKKKKT